MPLRLLRRIGTVAVVAGAIVASSLLPAAAASAADGGTGWVRVAHLSPDTKRVDVRIVALSGGSKVVQVKDIAYGAVSKYYALPTGVYAVAMRPAGASEDATPVIQASVNVKKAGAATVAVFGRNANLKTKIIRDDLASPAAGKARVRLVQGSTASAPVTITSSNGKVIARDAALATVSQYAATPAGAWKLEASQGTTKSTASVTLKSGQVVSLFVLDRSDGSISVRPVVDSSGVGAVPKGYLATGGGYLAHQEQGTTRTEFAAGAGVLAGGAAIAALLVIRRRRTARA